MKASGSLTHSAIAAGLYGALLSSIPSAAVADSPLIYGDYAGYQAGQYGDTPQQSYRTINQTTPLWLVNTWDRDFTSFSSSSSNSSSSGSSSYIFLNYLQGFHNQTSSGTSSLPMIFSLSHNSNAGTDAEETDFLSLVWIGNPTPLGYDSGAFGADQDPSLPVIPGAMNVGPQTLGFPSSSEEKTYLTYWGGAILRAGGLGLGQCFLYDENYELAYVINAVDDFSSPTTTGVVKEPIMVDAHDCVLTSRGSAVISVSNQIFGVDLTSIGGRENDTLLDSVVQDIDVVTGELLWEWRASDHFDVGVTRFSYESGLTADGFDWFHINSVEMTPDGNYLISARQLSSIVHVNGTNGEVIWTLGGDASNFTDVTAQQTGIDQSFAFQHDAHFAGSSSSGNGYMSSISLFNNHVLNISVGACSGVEDCSSGMVLDVDYDAMTYTVTTHHLHPKRLQTKMEGSHRIMPPGQTSSLMGWGANPAITEYQYSLGHADESDKENEEGEGKLVLDLQFGLLGIGPDAYRVLKGPWVGKPTWNPALVVEKGQDDEESLRVWVSWNGATEVKEWVILGASKATGPWENNSTQTTYSKRVSKRGFETEIDLDDAAEEGEEVKYVRVVGLGAGAVYLGASDPVEVATGESVTTSSPAQKRPEGWGVGAVWR